VFVFMAENTIQFGMFGVNACERVVYGLMAGGTIFRRHILTECYCEWLMGGMTGQAVFVNHFR